MGHCRPKRHHMTVKSHTLPSSPTHSSSSSDFEFTISASPRKSSAAAAAATADELFYKGQLLPLHLSPRLTMVRTLLLSSASASTSSYSDTTASRDSTASHSSVDDPLSSGRPSSVADDELKRLTSAYARPKPPPSKYFSLPKLFRKEQRNSAPPPTSGGGAAAAKRARDMIRRYLKKVKPFYEKLSQKQRASPPPPPPPPAPASAPMMFRSNCPSNKSVLQSFSGNLRMYYPKRSSSRSCNIASSCPSSMMSSPSHGRSGLSKTGRAGPFGSDVSSMEELRDAIQGAIAHCKNSMLVQGKTEFSLIN